VRDLRRKWAPQRPMFATIRKNLKWLWIVVIVLVTVSFVVYMGPTSGMQGGPTGSGVYGYVNGRPVNRDRFMEAWQEARLQFFLYTQVWPEDSPAARQMFDAERQVAERLTMMDKLEALKVHVDDRSVAQWLAQVFRDQQTGGFNSQQYRQFIDQGLRRGGIPEAAFRQFARREVGMRHLMELGGLTGSLIPPDEAKLQFRLQNEQIQTAVALFSLDSQRASVSITPEGLTNFFNQEAARYRVPDKVRVGYALFPATNYLDRAETEMAAHPNLALQLESIYLQRGTNSFRDDTGAVMTPQAAQEQLRDEMRHQSALAIAHRESTTFGERLLARYEADPTRDDHLESLAADHQLPSGVTEPFARFETPPGLQVGTEFAQAAFNLSPVQPMSLEPVVGRDGVYLMVLKERVPGYVPPLDQIRPQVLADFEQSEARRLAREAAHTFLTSATQALADGKQFEDLAEASGVTLARPPAFSSSTRSLPGLTADIDFRQLQTAALDLRAGELSQVLETRDGAMIACVLSRQPVEESRLETELEAFLVDLRQQRRQEALSEWFRKELELAQVRGLPDELRSSRDSDEPPL
jgi:hypothetical protein